MATGRTPIPTETSICIVTPTYSNFLHREWMAGVLSCRDAFPGGYCVETMPGSFLPRQRDSLTKKFFDSGATHMLCVDADLSWRASDVHTLLATGKDFVSGVYSMKNAERTLPFSWTGERDGELLGCDWAPGGFLLIARPVIERMLGAYSALQYMTEDKHRVVALWSMMFDKDTPYSSEDVSFCKRWTRLDGKIWAHPGVVLKHYGEAAFLPNDGWLSQMTSSP